MRVEQIVHAVLFGDRKDRCIKTEIQHMRRQRLPLTVVLRPECGKQELEGVVGMHVPVAGGVPDGLPPASVFAVSGHQKDTPVIRIDVGLWRNRDFGKFPVNMAHKTPS